PFFLLRLPPPPTPTLFPYTTLFRSKSCAVLAALMLVCAGPRGEVAAQGITVTPANPTISVGQTQQFTASGTVVPTAVAAGGLHRSEEHTSELQSRFDLVCRLLLEKK